MKLLRYLMIPLALLLVVALAACGGGSKPSGSGDEVKVSMKDMAFQPKEVKSKVGNKVTWANDDLLDHSARHKSEKPLFKSGDFGPGKSFSHTFAKAGTYEVICETPGHEAAGMTMKVVVDN